MKRNKIMFVIAIVAMLAVLFVACDDKGNQPEHTHTYGAWNITTQPTEDAAGTATRACACGETETTTVAKLSDTTVWTVTVSQDATHETAGFKAYKSDAFGTVTLTFPKGEHVYGAWEISKEPTKENTGVAIRKCACGHFEEVTLAVLTNTSVWTLDVEGATHETTGKEIYTSEYGVVTIITEVQQHVYGAWVDNHDGTHSRTCSCGDKQTENCVYDQEVAAPDFLKSAATCTAKAVYYKSCVCGAVDKSADAATFEVGTANGHDYVGFQVTQEPTCTEVGTVTAHCSVPGCGAPYVGIIPALGHDFSGECIPYVDSSTGGYEGGDEYDEEGGSDDECVYHVHTCTRCDAVDSAHKEKHALGAAVYTLHLVHGTDDMYEVWAKYSCEKCSYSTTVTDEFNRYIGQDDSWTVVEEVEADYNQAGHTTWRFSDGREITVYTDKLVGQYEGTTYVGLELRKSEDTSAVSSYTTGASVTFDKNGYAVGAAAPFMGDNTVRIINAVTGELTYVTDNKGSHYEDTGAIDFEHGVIVRSTFGDWERAVVMIPSTMNVKAGAVSGSYWTDSMALSFDATCSLGETHTYNVFVYNEKVYFNAQFVDMNGKAIAAKDCANASYVKVLDAEGNKIQAFAQKNGTLKATDGKEGYYSFDSGNVVLDGVGGVLVSGTEGGSYTAAAEGASYDYDVYIGESVESATAYYRLTLGESHTCTLVKPVANFRFDSEGVDVADVEANINVVTTLPTPVREGYVFNGWKLDGEGEDIFSFKALEENGDYRFTAQWTKRTKVTVVDVKDEDKAQYSIVYIGVGNAFTTVLPAYTENTYKNGYQFAGWYLDNGDGVLDTSKDQAIDDLTTADVEGADYVVIAAWEWAGNVEFVEQSRYAWEYVAESNTWRSTNWHVKGDKTSSTMEIKWTSGIVRIEFDYWVESENGYDYLTIYYYDANGTRQTVSTKGSNIAKGNAVHVVCILDGEGESLRLSYSKDSSGDTGEDRAFAENLTINGVSMVSQASLYKNAGVYTAEDAESINVGAGGLVTIGENSYAYSNVSDNTIGVMVGNVYREYTLNVAAKTYTVVEPKVNVSYNYKGHGENSTVEVGKYSNQTLASAPTADGFIFRGWYTDEELTKAASATFVASSDVTFYAKWDAAITLTYVYLDGTTANVVVDLYANDVVETLQAVDFNYGTKVFAGWFAKDGSDDGDWGTQFVANTALTANTTVYAKWIEPSVFAGTYTVVRLDNSGVNTVYNAENTKIVVDVFGNSTIGTFNGFSYGSAVSFTFEEGSTTSVIVKVVSSYGTTTIYKGVYDATSGTIVRADSTSGFGATIYTMVPYDSAYAKSDFAAFCLSENSKYYKLVSYADKTAENAQRTVFVADGTVSFDATWSAIDASDNAVTALSDVKSNADIVTIVAGETTYKYAKNNSKNFVAVDGYEGSYTTPEGTVRLNGAGLVKLASGVSGTYTKAADDAGYTFDVKTKEATYKLTINQEDGTWSCVDNIVNVTFVNDLKAVNDLPVFVGISTALPSGDAVKVDGYVFRGWYEKADFTGSAKTTVTLTENATYYAKYDPAVTLTYDYSGYEYEEGKTTSVVSGKYKNDKLGTLPTVAASVRYEGKVFVGWFLKDAEGNFAEQVSSSTVLSGDTTVYAKWVAPAASAGTYKGIEIYGTSAKSGSEKTSLSTTVLTVTELGKFTGERLTAGTLSDADFGKTNGAINVSRYAYLSDALGGIVVVGWTNSATSIGTDFYIGFKNYANITKVEYSADSIGGGYVAFFTVSYTEDGTAKTMKLFVYNETIYANVMWTDGVTAKAAATTDSVLISDSKGNVIIKKSGTEMVGNDGKAGTYTNADAYGDIVLDGYGVLTVGGKSVAYTLDGDKVSFVAGNAMRVIVLGDGTYTKALDGYQGTYTLPDETTMELDGYGNVTGTTKTYVVSGSNVTIYDGETSTTYGIDIAGKAFLGKSVFAGLTYRYGTRVYDYIKFDDGVNISGEMGMGANNWITKFTNGVINGNELTVTVVSCNCGGISAGQTIVFTIDGDTLTIKSGKFNSNAVDVAVGYSYTLEK